LIAIYVDLRAFIWGVSLFRFFVVGTKGWDGHLDQLLSQFIKRAALLGAVTFHSHEEAVTKDLLRCSETGPFGLALNEFQAGQVKG
jgi:hypothetical protein